MEAHHTRRTFLKHAGLGAAALSVARPALSLARARRQPNIIFIMIDDMGPQWTSCYGGTEIETPNVDELARTGMQFFNAYSMPQCTPTRATLLTGQYPFRTGWVNHWDVPRWGVGYFDWERYTTFATIMKTAGYKTAAAGKWQINDFRLHPDAMERHGFDDYCMWTGFEGDNKPSGKRYWDAYIHTKEGSKTYDGKFGPDVYTDFLIDFMRNNKDEPMMMYFPMALVHGPRTTTPHEPDVKGNEQFKAMVRYTDHLLGRLVEAMEDIGIRDNTIIIWSTDNGGGPTTVRNGRSVSGGKGRTTENGVCEPFIVNCPGLVPAKKTDALTDFTDLLPTFAELGGATVPSDLETDGKSFAKLVLGQADDSPRDWIMAMGGGAGGLDEQTGRVASLNDYRDRVIRDKQYKIYVDVNRNTVKMVDLVADPGEKRNILSSTDPNVVAARKRLEAVEKTFPARDASPKYRHQAPNPWDVTVEKKGRKMMLEKFLKKRK